MYEKILYPTDGSPGANAALDHVQSLASTYSSEIHILYAADTTHEGFGMLGDRSDDEGPGLSGEPPESDSHGLGSGNWETDEQYESFEQSEKR